MSRAMGRVPSVTAPLHPEQRLLATLIQNYGTGVVVDHRDAKDVVAGMQHVLANDSFNIVAKRLATELSALDQANLDHRLLQTVDDIVGKLN